MHLLSMNLSPDLCSRTTKMDSEMGGKQELDCRHSLLYPICLSFISLFASICLQIGIFQLMLLSHLQIQSYFVMNWK